MIQTSGEKSEASAIAEWLKHEYPDVADFLVSLDTRVQELEATVNNYLTVGTEVVTLKNVRKDGNEN